MKNLKDKITTYSAILLIMLGAANTFLQANAGQPINWQQLSLFVISAIIAYMTGKNPDGSTKTPVQIEAAQKPIETTQAIVDSNK